MPFSEAHLVQRNDTEVAVIRFSGSNTQRDDFLSSLTTCEAQKGFPSRGTQLSFLEEEGKLNILAT